MTDQDPHDRATALAAAGYAAGDTAWFEQLYGEAARGVADVPWHREVPNPRLVRAVSEPVDGLRALVVGCGYGYDAEHLASLGYRVTGFDLSPTAVAAAAERLAGTGAEFEVADVLAPPAHWRGAYDLVFEAYTIQVLRGADRAAAAAEVAGFVAPGGRLVVVGFAARPDDPAVHIAQPLTEPEVQAFGRTGLSIASVDLRPPNDDEPPPRWHYLAEFRRA